ncbi:transposase, partial [Ralstonia sp. VS2407]
VSAAGVVLALRRGVEEAIYDSYAMRRFMGLDFAVEQVPDATTLLQREAPQVLGRSYTGCGSRLRAA